MKTIIETVVKRPVTILMVILSVIILGIVSLSKLSIDFMPSVEVPYVSIYTSYKNAGPEEIEKSVTKIIEGAVATVNDIKEITSTSRENASDVTIEFNWGTDLNDASEDIREALEQVVDLLPDNADKPVIRKFSTDDISLMEVAIYGINDQAALYNIADNQIAPQIKQAKGVAQAEVLGGLKNEIKIDVNLNRLKAYNININDIASVLSRDNNNLVGGQANQGFYRYTIRTMGEIKSVDDIKNTIIDLKTDDSGNSSIVKIQDLAEVYEGYDDDVNIIKINGENSISISVSKESGANTAEVSKNVIKQLEEYNFPQGIKYEIMFNTADSINESIAGVLDAAWQGGLFAIIVLMIYMWNIRTVSIIAISIPLSIIVTFTLMYFMNVTLNVISLSGLVLGIGMMVDNSIVVLENIFYYRHHGYGKYSSAINGAYKVSLAISASTFTTIAVFLPFLYIEGMVSQIFRDLCITVTISMIASLLVAILIVPMFGARLITNKKLKVFAKLESLSNKYIHDNMKNIYDKILSFAIRRKKTVLIPSMALVFAVIFLGVKFIGKEGFPKTDEGQFMVRVTMPIGTKYEQTESFVVLMENDIREIVKDDLIKIQSRIRKGDEANSANMRIELKSKSDGRKGSIEDYIELIREKLQIYPAKINVMALGSSSGGSSEEAIKIEMLGDDVVQSKELGDRIVSAISNIEGIRGAMVDIDESNRELQIYVNRDIAAKMGLKVNDVARIINTSFAGRTATTITPENSDFTDVDVNVQLENIDKVTIDDVKKISIPVKGVLIPLSSIADIVKSYGPNRIYRKERKRYTTVIANIYGRPLNEVITEVRNNIDNNVFIPNGIYVNYGGDFEDMNEAFGQLIQALILALVLVYAIMASQFESLIAPFVIAFAIPFGFAGSLIALFITNTTLNAYSAIGFIVLIGIVVNNGIVLIDYMNQIMHEQHIKGDEAALLAGKRRLRPVLMTTLTTILGILPMTLGIGSGNEMYKPLATALLGGLVVSTMFTLIIVPTIYAAIRNKIPLKDYDKKDKESANDFAVNNALNSKS
ncbi:putative acriflavin resistance protein [Brachyspira hampsonii 30446]|uniref:Putative acriflavin resistance protein n=1 Tax=Brachyspira hampsonii 30446 TaxID=1289135 RepID=A0A2U4F7I5_9SPIR|nr:efflux RND transporter permease subunit [Brachyspira hampsonii]EKV57180.1 putative acriflavin resistance protein [Brachyspira hampsonii 30446]MBW5394307.1 efflux RND transporter permease subunit [Brachyspira hampsonii]OEJ19908.1 multidrug transporter [Brachyspira hampsonii]